MNKKHLFCHVFPNSFSKSKPDQTGKTTVKAHFLMSAYIQVTLYPLATQSSCREWSWPHTLLLCIVVVHCCCRMMDLRGSGGGCADMVPLTIELRPTSTSHPTNISQGFFLPASQVCVLSISPSSLSVSLLSLFPSSLSLSPLSLSLHIMTSTHSLDLSHLY